MQRWWKWLVGVAVVVPLLAYVGGSLAAAQSEPTRREPIRITVDPSTSTGSPAGSPTGTPSDDEPGDDEPGDDRDPSEGPETVRPTPDDLDDDSDDAGRDDDGGDRADDDGTDDVSDDHGSDDRSDDRSDDDRDDRSGHGGDDSDSRDDD